MKNQYKQRQRQIEKSIKGDWNQNESYFQDYYRGINLIDTKLTKPKLVIVNGKLTKVYKTFRNGLPVVWDDII
jgi:hypothetical protein